MTMTSRTPVPRLNPDPSQGLTAAQAAERLAAGWGNHAPDQLGKTTGQILRDNLVTFFNLIFLLLALCLFLVGQYRDMMFLGIVAANVLIGIVQELRVKRTLDRISLLSAPTAVAVRDGKEVTLPAQQLVLDDIVILRAGDQVCADAVVCTGEAEVNESLLTGEADLIAKTAGDPLLSGSFLSSGRCVARLDKVGGDSYAAGITAAAKAGRRTRSDMMRALDRMLRIIGVAVVPLGSAMLYKQVSLLHTDLPYAVSTTVAALVGMIPEGLYLLVSVALAVSVIALARKDTLVHELSCIEKLARVDVLCLDKTGTITEGEMDVLELRPITGSVEETGELLGGFAAASSSDNATARAIRHCFEGVPPWTVRREVPFSSERKWSALCRDDGWDYLLGAPEYLLGDDYSLYEPDVHDALAAGRRVLALVRGAHLLEENRLIGHPEPLCFVILADRLRSDAADTIRYFREQGVTVKVISGDNAQAVSEVARRAGIPGAERCLNLAQLSSPDALADVAEDCTVFGRVTPTQKRELIRSLQQQGHTVAMLGDGVNDVLALKDADCSIAMAAGSEAAQHVAQLVLLNSSFSALPTVVREGRRVINNIERSASLFLIKNIFSFLVALVLLAVPAVYPLVPAQISLISALFIGAPSFLLTFEPSYGRIRGHFLRNVFLNALPGGLTNAILIFALLWAGNLMRLPLEQISTVCALQVGVTGFLALLLLSWPLTPFRAVVAALMGVGFVGAILFLSPLFQLATLTLQSWKLLGLLCLAAPLLLLLFTLVVHRLRRRWQPTSQPRTAAAYS